MRSRTLRFAAEANRISSRLSPPVEFSLLTPLNAARFGLLISSLVARNASKSRETWAFAATGCIERHTTALSLWRTHLDSHLYIVYFLPQQGINTILPFLLASFLQRMAQDGVGGVELGLDARCLAPGNRLC
jgi:hypothetical protein